MRIPAPPDVAAAAKRTRSAPSARSRNGLLVMVFVFSMAVNALMLTGPIYMLQVYDRVLGSRSEETLIALSVLVTFLFLMMGMLDHARGRVMARVGARFQSALDGRVFAGASAPRGAARPAAPARATRCAISKRCSGCCPRRCSSPLFDMPWTPLFIAAIFVFHPWLGCLAVGGGVVLVVLAARQPDDDHGTDGRGEPGHRARPS